MTDDELLRQFEDCTLPFDATLRVYGPAGSADEFVDGQPQLWEKKNLRLFYSAELMMSPRAKREFVEPDLAPLPSPER